MKVKAQDAGALEAPGQRPGQGPARRARPARPAYVPPPRLPLTRRSGGPTALTRRLAKRSRRSPGQRRSAPNRRSGLDGQHRAVRVEQDALGGASPSAACRRGSGGAGRSRPAPPGAPRPPRGSPRTRPGPRMACTTWWSTPSSRCSSADELLLVDVPLVDQRVAAGGVHHHQPGRPRAGLGHGVLQGGLALAGRDVAHHDAHRCVHLLLLGARSRSRAAPRRRGTTGAGRAAGRPAARAARRATIT